MMRSGDGDHEGLGWFTRPARGEAPPPESAHEHAQGKPASARLRLQHFEFSSRGDRATGLLAQPDTDEAARPLVLLCDTSSPLPVGLALPLTQHLAREGMAVAQLDLPLHGARAEQKLAACVATGWSGRGEMASLAREFARQAQSDLRRTLDALQRHERLDVGRVAFVGVGLASDVGAHFCADDPRAAAAVLALASQREAAPELDPAAAVAAFGGRPLLLLDSGRGSARRLREAAEKPPAHHKLDAPGELGSEETGNVIRRFLWEALGL